MKWRKLIAALGGAAADERVRSSPGASSAFALPWTIKQ